MWKKIKDTWLGIAKQYYSCYKKPYGVEKNKEKGTNRGRYLQAQQKSELKKYTTHTHKKKSLEMERSPISAKKFC